MGGIKSSKKSIWWVAENLLEYHIPTCTAEYSFLALDGNTKEPSFNLRRGCIDTEVKKILKTWCTLSPSKKIKPYVKAKILYSFDLIWNLLYVRVHTCAD